MHLLLQLANGGTQAIDPASPAIRVVPAPTPLRAGFVYEREGNLWLTALDGVGSRQLTFYPPDVQQATGPTWAPDGGRVTNSHSLPAPRNQVPGWEIWSQLAPSQCSVSVW